MFMTNLSLRSMIVVFFVSDPESGKKHIKLFAEVAVAWLIERSNLKFAIDIQELFQGKTL